MTAVIGLDLSITATGFCLPDGRCSTIIGKAEHGDSRLARIADTIGDACRDWANNGHKISLAVLEDLPTHGKAAGITGMVHGAVRLELIRLGILYALVAPATLKAFATGVGNGNKIPMAIAALKRGGREFADDNQCDAWWLRAAGLDWLGEPEFTLPQAQRGRLTKAKWPTTTTGMRLA